MRIINVALVGFGNVGQSLARLFIRKRDDLRQNYGLEVKVTGIATGRHGYAVDPFGIDSTQAEKIIHNGHSIAVLSKMTCQSIEDFLSICQAEVLFESIPVNYEDGQPALDILRKALSLGMHSITANKGPVVHGYFELSDLAKRNGRSFLFESTVMDGTPIFSLFRHCLPAVELHGITGILNSTTNFILTRMEGGDSFDEALQAAQKIGITETDPKGDIDGWDAAIKLALLVTVLMGIPFKPQQVDRIGIRSIGEEDIHEARKQGGLGFHLAAEALGSSATWAECSVYDLDPEPGHGANAIDAFLARGTGYCEQFAGTFAVLARALERVGCAAVMPLASPIGTGRGLRTGDLLHTVLDGAGVPTVVDAGLGVPSDAAQALEAGADAVLVNTAVAEARDPVAMARAFALGVRAGRLGYLAGRMAQRACAHPSSPPQGVPRLPDPEQPA